MIRLALLLAILVVLLAAAVGWYFYGPAEIASDELVPADTVVFASIPNAVPIVTGYQSSQIKPVLENPNMQPLHDAVVDLIGQKNVDLFYSLLPNLSGQSFIAITHFDYDHPEQIGLIAGLKPKPGRENFDAFVEKLKAAYPHEIAQGKTGTGAVEGVAYDWIQGPGASDKICVARFHGWIVTSWGEAPLADWLERFQKKSTTPSLAHDADYRRALEPVGKNPLATLYVSYHFLADIFPKQATGTQPVLGGELMRKMDTFGGAALGVRFEKGEIVDRFSFLVPKSEQLDLGLAASPCPFETLHFTGPDTRFYWATSINWKPYCQSLEEELNQPESAPSTVKQMVDDLRDWAHSEGLDVRHNIIDAFGPEISVQLEWPENATYPEAGLLVKLDHPDQFKPTFAAIVDTARKTTASTAVVKEYSLHGQDFAALHYISPAIFTPTVTENGNYLGVFLNEAQAVRTFSPQTSSTLDHDPDFTRQIGDKRSAASQILFLDSPYLLDRAYRTALPYLPFAEMFNKDLARMIGGRHLPDDLTWLAPVGAWSCVATPGDTGVQVESISGIGNQGIFLTAAADGGFSFLQSMGYLPKSRPPALPVAPAATAPSTPSPNTPSDATSPPVPPQ